MEAKRLLSLQAERGAKASGADSMHKSIRTVITECRRFIQDRSESYRDLEPEFKREAIKSLIVKYVMDTMPMVEGFVDEENRTDTNKLIDSLVSEITDYGVLTAAVADPSVNEIRCNGKEIKIEKNGMMQDYKDQDGNIITFESVEQQEIVIRKLLGDVRLSAAETLPNARTVEGYRIAAVHKSAISPDPSDPTAARYNGFVLRKFSKIKMGLGELIRFKTLSDDMGRFISLFPEAQVTFVTTGPTSSGKTTTNNAALRNIPADIRVVLMQNPSEIDLRIKDHTGRVINDVIHIEAREIENPSPLDPTMTNVMKHFLRLSPTVGIFGEFRSNEEFLLALQIMQAGHPINGTYHSRSAEEAVRRFMRAVISAGGGDPSMVLSDLVDTLHIVIVQEKLRDNTRKIMQIAEISGIDPNDPTRPLMNMIYEFEVDDRAEYDEFGSVKEIKGRHVRVGQVSDKLIQKFKRAGISPNRYEFLLGEESTKVETYTGNL